MFYNLGGSLGSNPWVIIIIAYMVIQNLQHYLNNKGSLITLILSIPAILIAITFHEYAHAFAADKLGDDTPRRQGRLTLNPIKHIDPVGIMLLLFAGFGWGKPVQITTSNFNRTISVRKGSFIVSIAGPLMNFILAIVFSIIYGLLLKFASVFILSTEGVGYVLGRIILSTITINVGLGVFNLIPLPPLDGSKILSALLPKKARDWYEANQRILYIIFIIIWVTPLAEMIISPAIKGIGNALVDLILLIAG